MPYWWRHHSSLIHDKGLERLCRGILRQAIVQHLIQELIDQREVLANGLLP